MEDPLYEGNDSKKQVKSNKDSTSFRPSFSAEELMNCNILYTKNGREQKNIVSTCSLAALLCMNKEYFYRDHHLLVYFVHRVSAGPILLPGEEAFNERELCRTVNKDFIDNRNKHKRRDRSESNFTS